MSDSLPSRLRGLLRAHEELLHDINTSYADAGLHVESLMVSKDGALILRVVPSEPRPDRVPARYSHQEEVAEESSPILDPDGLDPEGGRSGAEAPVEMKLEPEAHEDEPTPSSPSPAAEASPAVASGAEVGALSEDSLPKAPRAPEEASTDPVGPKSTTPSPEAASPAAPSGPVERDEEPLPDVELSADHEPDAEHSSESPGPTLSADESPHSEAAEPVIDPTSEADPSDLFAGLDLSESGELSADESPPPGPHRQSMARELSALSGMSADESPDPSTSETPGSPSPQAPAADQDESIGAQGSTELSADETSTEPPTLEDRLQRLDPAAELPPLEPRPNPFLEKAADHESRARRLARAVISDAAAHTNGIIDPTELRKAKDAFMALVSMEEVPDPEALFEQAARQASTGS